MQKNSVPAAAGAVATSHTVFLLNRVDASNTKIIMTIAEIETLFVDFSTILKQHRIFIFRWRDLY